MIGNLQYLGLPAVDNQIFRQRDPHQMCISIKKELILNEKHAQIYARYDAVRIIDDSIVSMISYMFDGIRSLPDLCGF